MTHIKSLTNISSFFLFIYHVQGWRATFSWVFSVQALAMSCVPLMFRLCAWTECYVNCSYFQPTVKPSFLFLALFCSRWFSLLCSEVVAVDALACACDSLATCLMPGGCGKTLLCSLGSFLAHLPLKCNLVKGRGQGRWKQGQDSWVSALLLLSNLTLESSLFSVHLSFLIY